MKFASNEREGERSVLASSAYYLSSPDFNDEQSVANWNQRTRVKTHKLFCCVKRQHRLQYKSETGLQFGITAIYSPS